MRVNVYMSPTGELKFLSADSIKEPSRKAGEPTYQKLGHIELEVTVEPVVAVVVADEPKTK